MNNLLSLVLESDNKELLLFVLLGVTRLFVIVSFTPFFAPKISSVILLPLCFTFVLPACPLFVHQAEINPDLDLTPFLIGALIVKEIILGFLIAFISGVFFYAAMAAGMIIDNQRGASQAQSADIMNDFQNSPFGSVLMLSLVLIFYASGAIIAYISFVMTSFVVWPVGDIIPGIASAKMAEYAGYGLNLIMLTAMVLCSPFVIVSLMTDISLGLINRFAPQLNVFILSMPIKSGLCAALIVMFIQPYMEIGSIYMHNMITMLNYLPRLF